MVNGISGFSSGSVPPVAEIGETRPSLNQQAPSPRLPLEQTPELQAPDTSPETLELNVIIRDTELVDGKIHFPTTSRVKLLLQSGAHPYFPVQFQGEEKASNALQRAMERDEALSRQLSDAWNDVCKEAIRNRATTWRG